MKEVWKEVKGYEGKYVVSNYGSVRNIQLNKELSSCGVRYLYVALNQKTKPVHRLVYETFNGDITNNKVVDHIDNNTKNNRGNFP